MAKDLTTSAIERQNILNNPVALPRIQEALGVKALEFEGRYVLTKQATINEKTGGGTKYINRRDRDYLPVAVSPEEYEKFIGNMSVYFDKLLDENKGVLDRLKQ